MSQDLDALGGAHSGTLQHQICTVNNNPSDSSPLRGNSTKVTLRTMLI